MRLFIAINFSEKIRAQLVFLRDELRSRSKCGNFTSADNLHLTLAFLGECDAKQTSAAKMAMDAVSFEPLFLNIERIGRFKREVGDIWWAGVQENKHLSTLHSNLTDKLISAGFTLEKRKYNPHITLGRKVETDAVPWQVSPFCETVTSIELMKSERADGELRYTAIYGKGIK